jgi:DNA-binding Xre family transcriptional regulator
MRWCIRFCMKIVRSRLRVLIAEKAMREGRALSARRVSEESGASIAVVNRLANNTIREVPVDDLTLLCWYFGCEPGDIQRLEEVDDAQVEALRQRAAKKARPSQRGRKRRREG